MELLVKCIFLFYWEMLHISHINLKKIQDWTTLNQQVKKSKYTIKNKVYINYSYMRENLYNGTSEDRGSCRWWQNHSECSLSLNVPNHPIIPFIWWRYWCGYYTSYEGSCRCFAVQKHGGKRSIEWMEVYCGEKADRIYGTYMPEETFEALHWVYLFSIKRSLNHTSWWWYSFTERCVASRAWFICLRATSSLVWGVPSPVQHPELTDMVIFRENFLKIFMQGLSESRFRRS